MKDNFPVSIFQFPSIFHFGNFQIGKSKNKQSLPNSEFGKLKIQSAFTLIELLVVIFIIGILIGLSIFGLQGARTSARDAKRKSDLELIRSGIEIYKSDCNLYPVSTTPADPTSPQVMGAQLIGLYPNGTICLNTNIYINEVPVDPTAPVQNYVYYSLNGTQYNLCAHLEQGSPGVSVSCDDSGNPTPCGNGILCNYKVSNP